MKAVLYDINGTSLLAGSNNVTMKRMLSVYTLCPLIPIQERLTGSLSEHCKSLVPNLTSTVYSDWN